MADEYRVLLNSLLDDGYEAAIGWLARNILFDATDGTIGAILADIETEAAKLEKQGQQFTEDNPLIVRLESAVDDAVQRYVRGLNSAAVDIQIQAIEAAGTWFEQSAFLGLSAQEIAALGVTINRPDQREILEAVETTQTQAWRAELLAMIATLGGAALLAKVAFDKPPTEVASDLKDVVLGSVIPGTNERINPFLSRVSRLGRTLQMNTFRKADAIQQSENLDIIEKVIRIATLDNRVCFACLALHGSELRPGEVVTDHDYGRCTSVVIIKGVSRDIPTGQEWFDDLLEQERRGIISPGDARILELIREQQGASMRALEDGVVTLKDFIAYYDSPIWGDNLPHQQSLINILGQEAKDYYAYNLVP